MKLSIALILIGLASSSVLFAHEKQGRPELVVYTYDSLMSKQGWGTAVFPEFEKKCGCTLRVIATGDGGQVLSRLQLDAERGKPTAQVVVGLDQHLWEKAKPLVESWGAWRPREFGHLQKDARVGAPGDGFLPFDYGVFAFMADTQALSEQGLHLPRSLQDLLKPEWKRKIILEDPRTSTPGLAFLLFTQVSEGAKVGEFWKKLASQWLTLAPGWDAGYGLFLKKESPLVWSYTTSQAYHEENGDTAKRYRAVVLEEGHPLQIEGAALVKGALDAPGARDRAKAFLEFLISKEAQARIPQTQWMMPARSDVKLPASFMHLPVVTRVHRIETRPESVERDLKSWLGFIQG